MSTRYLRLFRGVAIALLLVLGRVAGAEPAADARASLDGLLAELQTVQRERAAALRAWQAEKERLDIQAQADLEQLARLDAARREVQAAAAQAEERAAAVGAYLESLQGHLDAIEAWIRDDRQRRLEQGGAILAAAVPSLTTPGVDETPPLTALSEYLEQLRRLVAAGDSVAVRSERLEIDGRPRELVVLRVGLAIEYAVDLRGQYSFWRRGDGVWQSLPAAWAPRILQAIRAVNARPALAVLPVPETPPDRRTR